MNALMKNWSLGYVGVDTMRVITKIKSVAEQLKSAKIKSSASDVPQNSKKRGWTQQKLGNTSTRAPRRIERLMPRGSQRMGSKS